MKKLATLLLTLALWAELSAPAFAAGFSDVSPSSPFAPAIDWAVERNITKGTTPTTFGPGNTCTNSHILTFLWRAAGRPGDTGNERASVAAWAGSLGIDTGNLDAPCTRAAAVTDIWKAQGSPAAGEAASFTDVDPGAPYAGAVSWAVASGVTNGTGGGKFSPESVCTRGQIVTFLHRALGGAAEAPKQPEVPASGTLANGKPITEENVHELLLELKAKYPDESLYAPVGTKIYTKIYEFSDNANRGIECAGWAALVSDYIFGKDGYVSTHKNFNDMRPGDVLFTKTHKSVVVGRTICPDCGTTAYTTSDSGGNYRVQWPNKWTTISCPHCFASYYSNATVITRYPTNVAQYNPKDNPFVPTSSGNSSSESSPASSSSESSADIPSDIHVDTGTPCGLCGKTSDSQVWSDDFSKHVCNDCYQHNYKAAMAYPNG